MNKDSIILIVEDEELFQATIKETLDHGGFKVVLTSSGGEAVKLVDAAGSRFLIVVTDVNLGQRELNGWRVARYARKIVPKLAIVYMTGDSATEWRTQCVTNSALLNKPFKPSQLITTIAQRLNSGSPLQV